MKEGSETFRNDFGVSRMYPGPGNVSRSFSVGGVSLPMSDRLTMLRRAMAMESTPLDYYIIPTHNAHGTVETNERRLQYISGFSGTSGLAIVSKTAGYLFVEPKDYDLAQKEVLLKHWFVIVVDAVYSSDYWASWLANRAENAVVGIDARLIQDDKAELLRSLLATKKSRIKLPSQNLIDRIWKDKSAGTSGVFSDKPLHIGPDVSRRLKQVQAWIKGQGPSTVFRGEGQISKEPHSGTLISSPEDIAFVLSLEGNHHSLSYLYIGLRKGILFLDGHPSEELKEHLDGMNVDVKRYKDFYVFLRHRQWGDGKVLISSHTSHAVVLLLTEGYSQWYTLAPRYVDHLRTIEGGTDMSIKSWIKHNNILFEDETNIDITLSIREEIVRDATFLARAKGEKGLSIRPFDTNYSSDSYMPIQQDDRTTVLQTTRIMIMTWLQDIVESADACHQVCELRENEAEDYEEALQKVLDWTSDTTNFKSLFPFASDKDVQTLRRRTRRLLINLVKESQQLPPSLFIKETVDNYGKDPIAGGGFADIFKGLCGGKAVAMKRVRFFLTQTREVVKHRRMFAQEVLVWRQLKHDSILPLRGIWSQSPESVPYMILPWMNNGNAMNYTQDVSVASQTVDRLLREIAEGLIYLHAEDIIHGDLCGRNILIDESCHAKLCDFGLASLFTAPNSQLYSATSRMTQGSLPWMAPELLNSGPTLGADSSEPTYRSDVYAFGVVGWELYSGQTPFAGLRDFEIHSGVSSGRKLDNPGAGAYGRTMSRGLWALLLLCMRHTASDRPNAVTILESLQLL